MLIPETDDFDDEAGGAHGGDAVAGGDEAEELALVSCRGFGEGLPEPEHGGFGRGVDVLAPVLVDGDRLQGRDVKGFFGAPD